MNNRKDSYFYLLVCQSVVILFLSLFISFYGKTNEDFRECFDLVISDNSRGQELSEDAQTMLRAVFSSRQQSADPQTELDNEAVGGVDVEVYEAERNTSFAPVFSTAKILNPIENGRYTSFFGYRINPITGKLSFHTGLDIAAPEGTNISAAFGGTVSVTGEDSRAGKYLIIDHDSGLKTFYCHCSEILVSQGTVIRQGETVALVGSTGWSTGPHLHFEVRKNNIRYNPLWLLENDCRA